LTLQNYRLTLDLQCFAQEKTEQATPKKRQESRKKGEVAKSQELPGAFIMFITFLFLLLYGGFMKDRLIALFSISFHEYMLWDATQSNVIVIFGELLNETLVLLAPILVTTVVIAILGNYMQIGFLVSADPLKVKLKKLDPIQGAKRIFALRAVVEFLKSVLKFLVIGIIVFFTLWNQRMEIVALSSLPLDQILRYIGNLTVILGITIAIILIVLAVLDYFYQKYDFEKNQRMSKQDIKDEYKKSEGDPLIKGKIREKQRRMALQRMMQDVPKADVIITNPTHFAIAIRYDPETMESPTIIAKGKDYVALKIKEKAKEYNIITMENKPLARALYDQVEIGQTIPNDLFQAVAEVLAYVYKVKRKA
jgi:flagellar biosynthetic protein FlhB